MPSVNLGSFEQRFKGMINDSFNDLLMWLPSIVKIRNFPSPLYFHLQQNPEFIIPSLNSPYSSQYKSLGKIRRESL